MEIIIEIKSGPMAGKQIHCRPGESVAIGRDPAKSQFAVSSDKHMSGLHFTVECGTRGGRLIDRKSSNGTFLNGKSIKEATITDGDEIGSGQTTFLVHIAGGAQSPGVSPFPGVRGTPPLGPAPIREAPKPVANLACPEIPVPTPLRNRDQSRTTPESAPSVISPRSPLITPPSISESPLPSRSHPMALSVGSWALNNVPDGWEVQEGFGLRRNVKPETFPSSIVVMEESLGRGISFAGYVESQISMFREYLRESRVEPSTSPEIEGTEEKLAFDAWHKTQDNVQVFYRRIYVRRGFTIGVLTLTVLEKDSAEMLQSLDSFWRGLAFRPTVAASESIPSH